MAKKDSSSSSEGQRITGRQETTKTATRNTTEKKPAEKKKKKRNRVEEVAENLGFARSTTYDYFERGELPGEKVGHRWVVPDDLEERIKELAWEKWRRRQREKASEPENDPPADEKPQRQRKEPDDENES